ncbi:MAG: hypothetical protein H7293_11915 [Candidatus Saccharibacteria bacterium]|nr:hypothetical protein [Rhodoferax sp.]
MSKRYQRILIHPEAPSKPVPGAPCNGCGVCCLLEPCPLGMLLSKRRQGACVALQWNESLDLYRCGALSAPEVVLQSVLSHHLQGWIPVLSRALAFFAGRWIAVNQGCDSSLELVALRGPPEGHMISPTMKKEARD